jgi:hypothetical protein
MVFPKYVLELSPRFIIYYVSVCCDCVLRAVHVIRSCTAGLWKTPGGYREGCACANGCVDLADGRR